MLASAKHKKIKQNHTKTINLEYQVQGIFCKVYSVSNIQDNLWLYYLKI